MNIFEFAEEFKLSVAKARKIKKRFPQFFKETETRFDAMRATLAKGNRLTAPQLVQLVESPGNLLELGRYAATAQRELDALGKPQAAPLEVTANLMEAAKGEPEAVEILVNWLRSIIPPDPVEHAYLAVRILLGVPENQRKFEAPRISRAFLNARNHPGLAGWFRLENAAGMKNKTIYQKLALDL